jgi:hypothetical protein
VVGGTIYAADTVASQAQSDAFTAYNNLAGQSYTTTFGDVAELGSRQRGQGSKDTNEETNYELGHRKAWHS